MTITHTKTDEKGARWYRNAQGEIAGRMDFIQAYGKWVVVPVYGPALSYVSLEAAEKYLEAQDMENTAVVEKAGV